LNVTSEEYLFDMAVLTGEAEQQQAQAFQRDSIRRLKAKAVK